MSKESQESATQQALSGLIFAAENGNIKQIWYIIMHATPMSNKLREMSNL